MSAVLTDFGDIGGGLRGVYLDNHLLVIAKPAGMLAQADRTGDADVLAHGKAFLKAHHDKPGAVFLGLVHRLDRPVSGVMVLARTSKSAARLSAQFRARSPVKRYAALVEGRIARQLDLTHYIRKARPRVEISEQPWGDAKRARLRAHPLWTDGRATLLDVQLETGRPHQIRAQLSHIGSPLVGDGRYGARGEPLRASDGGTAIGLHAYALTVEHPTRREPVIWTAAVPSSWPPEVRSIVAELSQREAREGSARQA